MSRAIVHKTKGKLDLRSITTFGLNSKPNSDTPIGYFGTGLKYALAVLARENIPVTIYIDGKKWTLELSPSTFRDKKFNSLALKRWGNLVFKTIPLPFTTDLGKNWEIWQAFRELECNTRDEKGMTFIGDVRDDNVYVTQGMEPTRQLEKGYTYFVIQDERYIEEWLNKDKHFLKDGLTAQTGTDRLQVFPVKSNCIYYRGIRIYDLKEPSVNTYNFLCQIELTEDRTAKNPFSLEYEIEQFLGSSTQEVDLIKRAITAPEKTYEYKFDYSYTSTGDAFLDEVESNGEDATPATRARLRSIRPPEKPKNVSVIWQRELIDAVQRGDWDSVEAVISANREACIGILERSAIEIEKEMINNAGGAGSNGLATRDQSKVINEEGTLYGRPNWGTPTDHPDDDIPF